MTESTAATDLTGLWRSGAEALRRGDNAAALQAFQTIVAAGRPDPAVWTGVALAARNLGDTARHLDALDQILARDPRDLRALMMKGDHFAAVGDLKAAGSFYTAVTKLADATRDVPPDLAADVARARAANRRYEEQYEQHLRQFLQARGLGRPGTERNAVSLDLLLGKKRIFLQEPRAYYFPGLPQIEFYNRADFPWFDRLEAAWTDIRDELLDVLKDDGAFTPYMEGERDRPVFDELGLLGDPSWGAFHLWKNGDLVAENAARCPKTLAALEDVPLCRIPGRTPSVLFSALRPGVRIPPHHGFMNTRLICHLPLIVPENCGLRVGNDSRAVEAGRGWVFDDSIEHEAWNNSRQLRVILLFDIWRPELTPVERDMVSATLEAIEQFGGQPLVIDS
jgi:aspartyl/asparaginyl beta-hydroxylase (cupin superfamily)